MVLFPFPSRLLALAALSLVSINAVAATYAVDSVAALQSRIAAAVPGDVITLKDGAYVTAAALAVKCAGSADHPITIEAQTVGGVDLGGTHGFEVVSPAAWVVIRGFKFTHAAGHNTIAVGATHIRFTRNTFQCSGPGAEIDIAGDDAEIDRNEFRDKKLVGNMVSVTGLGEQVARRVWLHHNYFHDYANAHQNGAETVRFGRSFYSMSRGDGLIEYNLFVRCVGENEIITNKSCANTYRYNTFLDSPGGELSQRHGNDCLIYGNYFRGTQGIRASGDRHQIFSNYLEENSIAITICNGDGEVADGAKLTSHDRPDDCVVSFNTLVNNKVNFQMGARAKGLGATNITFANNIIQGGGPAVSISKTEPYPGAVWQGNLLWQTASVGDIPASGYVTEDPHLATDGNGVFHLQAGSPAIGSAVGKYSAVVFDLDGQPRADPKDKGADQYLPTAPVTAHLLTPADVGPASGPNEAANATHAAALPAPDADDGGINLPPGFRGLIVADNLVVDRKVGKTSEKLRFLAVAPNGDLYAKLYHGKILALRDTDGDGRADKIEEFGPGDGGTHIQFHDGWLYHSSRTAVYRYKYIPGELVPSSPMETVIHDLPAEKDHDAKAFAFDDQGRMIVEVGSPYNIYADGDRRLGAKGKSPAEVDEFQKTYGGFWRFDPNKLNQTQADGVRFSTGHRHSLALAWHPTSHEFFMVMMGRDQMNTIAPEYYDELDNAERDAEEMHLLREGVNIGWPFTYWDPIKKARMVGPEYGGDNRKRDDNPLFDKPVVAFPAHWAPLQMALYTGTQFPAHYRNGMFVAFHGSWNRAPRSQAGYKVCFVPFNEQGLPTGAYEEFADGFPGTEYFTNTRDARYRPSGVAMGPDGSLYVSETEKGRIWRIIYTGETAASVPAKKPVVIAAPPAPKGPIGADTPGGKFYVQVCAACHMPNGSGVPAMQPALAGNATVAGNPNLLIKVILRGPAAALPAEREKFSNVMPAFGAMLNDADVASLVNYLRANFAPGASEVTAAQVAAQRALP